MTVLKRKIGDDLSADPAISAPPKSHRPGIPDQEGLQLRLSSSLSVPLPCGQLTTAAAAAPAHHV